MVKNSPTYRPTETLAREIVAPFVSKTLSRVAGVKLASLIDSLVRARTAAMLTYGPDEIARIARDEQLNETQVRAVLTHAGGQCTTEDGVVAAWDRHLEPAAARDFLGFEERKRIADEIELLLHASRDGMRNVGVDTKTVPFSMSQDGGYYNEAFGMVRALGLLGYGYLTTRRSDDALNLQSWFEDIKTRVLVDEGYTDKTHRCDPCLARYGKDDSRKGR